MTKHKFTFAAASLLGAARVAVGCAVYTAPTREETLQVVKSSFQERGIAKLDRLNQSELQAACSEAALAGKELAKGGARAPRKAGAGDGQAAGRRRVPRRFQAG